MSLTEGFGKVVVLCLYFFYLLKLASKMAIFVGALARLFFSLEYLVRDNHDLIAVNSLRQFHQVCCLFYLYQ